MRYIDQIPYPLLIVVSVFMLGAPFQPEPHLVEKWAMLRAGALSKPLDIFDVIWHLLPVALLVVKTLRLWRSIPDKNQPAKKC